tara:strand:+ start:833 stop:1492 length:660 start_codon:yes stop_codon:yes gene_type:complete
MAGTDPAIVALGLGGSIPSGISTVEGYMDADNYGELMLNSLISSLPAATGIGGAGLVAALDPVLREKMTAAGQAGQGMWDEWNIERNYKQKVNDLERRAAVANQAGDVQEQMNILKERLVVEAEYAETIGNVRSSIGESINAPTPELDRAVQEEAQRQAKRTEPEVTVAMDSGDKMPKQESAADKILKNRMRRMGAAGLIGSVAGLPIASALMKDRDQG